MIALQRATPHIGDCCIEGVLQPSTESARWAPTPFDDDKKTSFPCISILSPRCRTKKHFSKLFFSCCPKSSQLCWFAASPLATGSNVRLSTCRPTGTHDPSIPETFKAPQPMSLCYILISGSPKCPAASLLPKHGFPANAVAPGSKTSASKLDRCCNRAAHAVRRTYLIQFASRETSKHETSCVVKFSWGKHAVQLIVKRRLVPNMLPDTSHLPLTEPCET